MNSAVSWLKQWGPHLVICGAVFGGVVGLRSAVGWPIAVAAGILALLASRARFNEVAGRLIGAVVVGTLVLFAANVLIDEGLDRFDARVPILLGLVLAVTLFGAPAAWYLRGAELGTNARWGRGARWNWITAVSVAAMLAMLLIVGVPIIVARGSDAWPVGLGVLAAVCLLGAGAQWYPTHAGWRWAGAALGALLIALVPLVAIKPRVRGAVSEPTAVKHLVDVRIVTDGEPHQGGYTLSGIHLDPAFGGLDVRYSVGHREGHGVRWTLVGASRQAAVKAIAAGRKLDREVAAPVTRRGADSVLLLLVDGTPPVVDAPGALPDKPGTPGEVGTWRRVSHAARERKMPAYALLQTSDHRRSQARLRRWKHFTATGGALSVKGLERRVITEAGVALAVSAPTAQADLALAITHRPILLFDDAEPVPRPLSIDWLFASGSVGLCEDDRAGRTGDCPIVRDAARLRNGSTHLQIEQPSKQLLQELAKADQDAHTTGAKPKPLPGKPPAATLVPQSTLAPVRADAPVTAIYVHPVSIEVGDQRMLYLDYWWYFADNPVPVGDGALCGAGLVIAGVTCHNHASDWEGLTVVINRTKAKPRVVAVNYAQHDSIVRYEWTALRKVWDDNRADFPTLGAADLKNRPLAYIAQGTHSTYPLPCTAKSCSQVAGGPKESRHNGRRAWLGNYGNTCGPASCVQELPTTLRGQKSALWNAYDGTWGSDHCELTYYCDSATPPKAPGQQGRYRSPSDCDGEGTIKVINHADRSRFKTTYEKSRSCH